MLVPRSFSYSGWGKEQKSTTQRMTPEEKGDQSFARQTDQRRRFGWRPHSYRNVDQRKKQESTTHPPVSSAVTDTNVDNEGNHSKIYDPQDSGTEAGSQQKETERRSQPVAVPGRSKVHRKSQRLAGSSPNIPSRRSSTQHDPSAMPPSVAALLAMTSIPRKTNFSTPRKASTLTRGYSSQHLMEEWKQDLVTDSDPLGTSPNLHVLLSPSDDTDRMPRSSSEDTFAPSSHSRSLSAGSMPSLTADDRSISSSSLQYSPREVPRRSSRQKAFSLSESVEDDLDHPLSFSEDVLDLDLEKEEDEGGISRPLSPSTASSHSATPRPSSESKPSAFKSNLTASLSALRSSWRSLSNFAAAPYTIPDDHLSRGFFADSQRIQREMRPRPLTQPPSAELRRYLNPTTHLVTPHSDLHYHGGLPEHVDYDGAFASMGNHNEGLLIALQDRIITDCAPALTSGSGSEAGLTEAGRAMQDSDQQYRRELRENSEWLRICVLETNMRRAGKIDGAGHARIWLPAREVIKADTRMRDVNDGGKRVPLRWVAISA